MPHSENNSGDKALSYSFIESFSSGIGREAQSSSTRNSRQTCGTVDEQEAQGLHAEDSVAIGSFARARFGRSQGRMQLETAHQIMSQDGELLPGAISAIVIGGNHIEGKLALEFGNGLFLGAATSSEVPQGLRGKGEVGRHRRVFEVTVVGREQIELVILGALMMHPFAVDHHAQLKSPGRRGKPGFEATDIGGDRAPVRLGGDQGFDSGPLTEGDFDRVKAALADEQLEENLLEKGRIHAEFEWQRTPEMNAQFGNQLAHKGLCPLGVVNVAGPVLELENLSGLRQMGEQRIVTEVVAMMRIITASSPRDFGARADDGAVQVDGQSGKLQLFDLLIEQFAVESRQRTQRDLSKLFQPVDDGAVAGEPGQTTRSEER